MVLTAREIAERLGVECEGEGSVRITGVAGIREAKEGEITFVANPRYASDVAGTAASAVVVGEKWNKPVPSPAVIRVKDPDRAFADIAVWFAPPEIKPSPGVHPSAVVARDVVLGRDVSIGPYCVIEPGVKIGDNTVLFAHCYLGHGVKVGSQCRLYPLVSVREYCSIGDRVIIHNGVVIGSDGFGYSVDAKGVRHKIAQLGTVVIGDDVEIGANSAVDRARFGQTKIGNGVKIDNLVQVAHNVIIGDHSVLCGQVGIAGSTTIGSKVIFAGQAGTGGHVTIGDGAVVGGQSGVSKDVPPGAYVFGYPAAPYDKAVRAHANVMRLPELKERVAALEKRLEKLEGGKGSQD